jgi:hypothetical protein
MRSNIMTDHTRSIESNDEVTTALELLSAGVPLTLLLDLATPVHSREIYELEAGRADWLAGVA